jgi:hypothetical protein
VISSYGIIIQYNLIKRKMNHMKSEAQLPAKQTLKDELKKHFKMDRKPDLSQQVKFTVRS